MKKTGILGGTFDPVHFGHLNLAISIMEECSLDEVLFVPASLSPFKEAVPPIASAQHRKEMLKLAIAPIKQFRILDWELQKDGPAFTIDTVRKLAKDPTLELHLILGEDHLASLHRWKEADELFRLAPPLIGTRGESGGKTINIPSFDISSTQVRDRLSQKKYCGHLVPAAVLEYIDKNKLYE
jgi:nicotinate-nucleotide adenylyltransferase